MVRSPYEEGRIAVFMKLGIATQSITKKPSTSEMENPVDNGDDNLPAGTLARTLAAVDEEPELFTTAKGEGSTEERMNRQTTWTEPNSIPFDNATGPSPIIPGSF